ncbi:hypothetical protein K501DRAFT_182571 [Backusella circina FSU 941]|nr:hypothetical protein K501DRAFT_182571 [Backusella circina FSU 941]
MYLAKQEAIQDNDTDAPTLDENADSLFEELCTAAKEGDQEKVESLVKNFGAPINVVDDWQCSPLYWACLCGHYPVVKFLLENGAQCDRNTFQGDIKNLLLSYKITKAIDENQPYLLFLSNTLDAHPHSDLTFTIQVPHSNGGSEYYAHQFRAHRFVLAARSHYFHKHLADRWRDHYEIKLQRSLVLPGSFLAILRYIYTGHLGDLDPDVLENMAFASKHLELTDLQTKCEQELLDDDDKRDAHKAHSKKEIDRVRSDFEQFYKQLSGTFIYAERQDNAWTMRSTFPEQGTTVTDPTTVFADIVVQIDNVLFPAHKVCLCRSEFFNMMLSNPFHEADIKETPIYYNEQQTSLFLQVVELHSIQPETFLYIQEYLYTDRCTIPTQEAFDVMLAADMLLLDKLKSIAAIALTSQPKPVMDIYDMIRTAVQLNVDRLEQYCIKYFAEHLEDYIQEEAFLELIKESAESIKMRQETDSIPFLDDLRYFLSKIYCIADEDMNEAGKVDEEYQETWTEMEAQYNKQLELLEGILETLGLEA